MPVEIAKDKGNIVVISATGKLVKEDYPPFIKKFNELAHESGPLSILFDMTRLDGWDAEGIWEELKFDIKHNSEIGRMAVVGNEAWHHLLADVSKPLAAAEIRYFHQGEADQARHWLLAPSHA